MNEFYPNSETNETIADHVIFSDALELQRDFDNQYFDSRDSALNAIGPHLARLNKIVDETNILNKAVTMTGLDIIVPVLGHNPITGMESLGSSRQIISGHPLDENPPISGKFRGFSPVVAPTSEGSHVDIYYKISLNDNYDAGTFAGSICAQGNITSARLTFVDDKQVRDASIALDRLSYITHDEPTKHASIYIRDLLTPEKNDKETPHEPYRLAQIGRAVRDLEHEKGSVDMHYRDAVIDLVTARLGAYPESEFTIEAPNAYVRGDGVSTVTNNQFQGSYIINGIAFAPHYNVTQDKIIIDNEAETLSVVITVLANDKEAFCYIPFEKIQAFKPVTN